MRRSRRRLVRAHAVDSGVLGGRGDALLLVVEPEQRLSSRAVAAAIASTPEPVPTSSTAPRRRRTARELEQQREAQPGAGVARRCRRPVRGRSRARSRVAVRRLRRAPTAAARAATARRRRRGGVDEHRPVELAPALLPVVGDLAGRDLDQRPAGERAQVGQRGQLAGRPVDGVLDARRPSSSTSSTPAGASSSSSASTSSGCSRGDANGEPDHAAWLPSARRSFANIDSCERRFSSREAVVELLRAARAARRSAGAARRR